MRRGRFCIACPKATPHKARLMRCVSNPLRKGSRLGWEVSASLTENVFSVKITIPEP